MTETDKDPKTGPGTTNDPNQADRTGLPGRDKYKDVPEESSGEKQKNTDPKTGPGTTSDLNQADRT